MVRYESVVLDGAAIDALLADDAARERLCAELFAEYDTNKDGGLSKAEIKPAVLGLGIDMVRARDDEAGGVKERAREESGECARDRRHH